MKKIFTIFCLLIFSISHPTNQQFKLIENDKSGIITIQNLFNKKMFSFPAEDAACFAIISQKEDILTEALKKLDDKKIPIDSILAFINLPQQTSEAKNRAKVFMTMCLISASFGTWGWYQSIIKRSSELVNFKFMFHGTLITFIFGFSSYAERRTHNKKQSKRTQVIRNVIKKLHALKPYLYQPVHKESFEIINYITDKTLKETTKKLFSTLEKENQDNHISDTYKVMRNLLTYKQLGFFQTKEKRYVTNSCYIHHPSHTII